MENKLPLKGLAAEFSLRELEKWGLGKGSTGCSVMSLVQSPAGLLEMHVGLNELWIWHLDSGQRLGTGICIAQER